MKLAKYLDDTKISDAEFARRLGVAHSLVHGWRYGKKTPSLAMAKRIRAETMDSVREEDWLKEEGAAQPAEARP